MVQDARRQLVWLVAVVVASATQKNTTTREAVEDTAGRDDAGRNDRMPIERTMRRRTATSHEEQLKMEFDWLWTMERC